MGGHHTTTKAEHSAKYSTHLERARHGGFQTFDAEHRTDSRRPLDQPPGTTTETDEDEDSLALQMSEVAAPLQLTTPQSNEDGERRRQTHSGNERSGSSLTADDTPE